MRKLLLDDSFSQAPCLDEPVKPPQLGRRRFLQVLGVAGVGLALSPQGVLAQDSEAARWRARVTDFVYTVCNNRRANAITRQLSNASLQYTPTTTVFHYYYAAPVIFVGTTISPEEVTCGNGFEVNRFPFYDVQCPCRGVNDLNAFEIRSITNATEVKEYGCVLAPASRRTPLEYRDHANYRLTTRNYDLEPDQFQPEYKRVFTGKGRAYYGYQIRHKTQVGSNGKPIRAILLSSTEI